MESYQVGLQEKALEIQTEAQANTKILEEIAGLERYISETYISRVFYELIQNADDCKSTKFVAKKVGGDLFFLNDGDIFTCDDLESICRSAFSTKQRGINIGYRGIGFKSTSGVADQVSIYSGELEIYFSKSKTKELFSNHSDVPLLRVPHWGSISDSVKEIVQQLLSEYCCTTCFVLHNVNEDQLLQDMKGIKSNAILFLKSITNITIGMGGDDCITVARKIDPVVCTNSDIPYQDMEIGFKSVFGKKIIEEYKMMRIWSYKKISIASDLKDNVPIRLPRTKAYAQAFLPMLTVTGLGAVINGDFSTDPSRTRIATDDHTKNIMGDLIGLFGELLQRHNEHTLSIADLQLLEIIIPYHKSDVLDISPSIIASTIKSASKDAGINYSSFLIRPAWMTDSDYIAICRSWNKKSLSFEQLSSQDSYSFFKSIGASELSLVMLFDWLEEDSLSSQSTMNLIKYVNDDIRELKCVQSLDTDLLQNAKLITCSNKEINSASEVNDDPTLIVDDFAFESINNICGGLGSLDWHLMLGLDPQKFPHDFLKKQKEGMIRNGSRIYTPLLEILKDTPTGFKDVAVSPSDSTSQTISVKTQFSSSPLASSSILPETNKPSWRKAEVLAVDILASLGLDAKDVSKRNCGCDLIGIDKSNSQREVFVEVKLLDSIGSEFRITDNEIYSAKDRGENYWILLIVQPDKNQLPTHISVIKNAYQMIESSVERRCVKYESFCSDYKAEFTQILFN